MSADADPQAAAEGGEAAASSAAAPVASDAAAADGAAASQEPKEQAERPAPTGSLSSRLKDRGLDLTPIAIPERSKGGVTAAVAQATSHAPLSTSSAEKSSLFTPIEAGDKRKQQRLEEANQRRKEAEDKIMKGIEDQLKKWVKGCLASDDTRQKLLGKGMLKCRLQARWSEGLNERIKALVTSYGGKLATDGDKDPAARGPAWAQAAELRNERWLVGFDAAAFETFMKQHPETVDPPETSVREFVRSFIATADLDSISIKTVIEALREKFGAVRQALVNRAKAMVVEEVQKRQEGGGKGKRKGAPGDKKNPAKRQKIGEAIIETSQDVEWAGATLAPLGLKETGEPVVRSPASVALPILNGLKALHENKEFHSMMKSTKIGKVINGLRRHPSAEVSGLSKELLATWKATVAKLNKNAIKRPPPKPAEPEDSQAAADGDAAAEPTAAGDVEMGAGESQAPESQASQAPAETEAAEADAAPAAAEASADAGAADAASAANAEVKASEEAFAEIFEEAVDAVA
eukprot:TRINITY_DN37653_c0_g1_i1.p1 TRINITY_DN37653_c0_g1~~TRINITY_DN37653_c0_g1_i1.p1  ORF type:complete len:537 (-),score=180.21 TRINITY_DN37653_c0_g1_i1:411-1973(-)